MPAPAVELCEAGEAVRARGLRRARFDALMVAAALVAGSLAFWGFRRKSNAPAIPTAVVRREDFVNWLSLRGDTEARRSVTISAPYRAGSLQILQIVSSGAKVKAGAVLVRFDATTLRQTLAQDENALKSSEADIEQSRAQARLKEEQDLTNVLKARYGVQSAQLDASKQEILSRIDGEESKLKLSDARQQLAETEAQERADRISDAADVQSKEGERDKALFALRQDERGLRELTLRAPIDGIVTLLETNWQGPLSSPLPFRPGDRAWPGAPIAELPDLSTLDISARVDEAERGLLLTGQPATVRVDAVPDREFTGRVKDISTLASMDFSAGWPFPRNFKVMVFLDRSDPRLRPGMVAAVRVAVERVRDGIVIPAESVFSRGGRNVVYVLRGSRFAAREVSVLRRSEDQVLVGEGIEPGERVALKDPARQP